jgi:flagellar biosynthesis/type III secretory pathway chaperone
MIMQAVMDEISKCLGQEVELYRQLLDVVGEEREILLHGDHQRLMGTSERKMAVCLELTAVQESRRELMQKISPDSDKPLKLSDLAKFLPSTQQSGFRALVAKLSHMTTRLASLNQANKSFIEEALDTVEGLLQAITGGGGMLYGNKGMRQNRQHLPRLVTREV